MILVRERKLTIQEQKLRISRLYRKYCFEYIGYTPPMSFKDFDNNKDGELARRLEADIKYINIGRHN